MKKTLLTVACLLLLTSWASAQVIVNFETDIAGFNDYGWISPSAGTLSQAASPIGSGNSLQVALDGSKGAGITVGFPSGKPDATPAQVLTYFVYLPPDTPDSLSITLFAQDHSHWHHEQLASVYAVNIPKGVWCPIDYPLKQVEVKDPTNFDVVNNSFGWCGMNIYLPSGSTWAGNIYIDNVSLIGVKPVTVADFETDLGGYSMLTWGGGVMTIERVATPAIGAGSLQINYPPVVAGNPRDDMNKSGVGATSSQELVYWVYVPTDAPDSLGLQIFCQDNNHWKHNTETYYAKDIPKEIWYPLYFDLKKHSLNTDPNLLFDPVDYGFGWFGFEIQSYNLHDADLTWNGHIWVDNVCFLSDVVMSKWVVADFETPAQPTDLFANSTVTGQTSVALSNVVDPANAKNHVLQDSLDLTKGDTASIQRDGLLIYNSSTSTWATQITVDFFDSTGIPAGATVSLALNGVATGNVLLRGYQYSVDSLTTNTWNTIAFNVDSSLVTSAALNPQQFLSVIIQITYPSAGTWKGNVYFDNLTFIGISTIPQVVASPFTITTVQSTDNDYVAGTHYEYVKFEWVDNLSGKETYNIYLSTNGAAVTSLLRGVQKIASGIPHGQKQWGYRPYTTDGSQQTMYFAVTATSTAGETAVTSQCKGTVTINTSVTPKVQYDANFGKTFMLNGGFSQFSSYAAHKIIPEWACAGTRAADWTRASKDFNYDVRLVIDSLYLYIGGYVTDDVVNLDPNEQSWSGDALEFFMGFYDVRPNVLKALHPKNSPNSAGDWRIGITSLGQFANGGPAGITLPGCEATATHTDTSWTIVAKLSLDSLAAGGKFGKVLNGMWLPFKIDGNDHDSTIDAAGNRGFMCEVGGWGGVKVNPVESDWLRPSTCGVIEVVGSPLSVAGTQGGLPKTFALYNNYPNPFNPTSTISYDLPKETQVSLKIYDILGREVVTLVDAKQPAGTYKVEFNAAKLASGVYIYRITAGNFVQAKKLMLLK